MTSEARVQIVNALDALIEGERGFDFQRLALQLARGKWPDLVATEVKSDAGEDAYQLPVYSSDERTSFGCSISATWDKVVADCERIKEQGQKPSRFVFYTARKVVNTTVLKWCQKIANDYKLALIVVSREDIVESLIRPENNWITYRYLGVDLSCEPTLPVAEDKARKLAQDTLESWRARFLSTGGPYIDLELLQLESKVGAREEGAREEIVSREKVADFLLDRRQIVLEGGPGAGKTVTLVQIAEQLIDDAKLLPILVDCASWGRNGADFLAYVASSSTARSVGLTANEIALLAREGRLAIIMNGWNEVSDEDRSTLNQLTDDCARELWKCGHLIATRPSDLPPPLTSPVLLRIQPLNRTKRREIIRKRFGKEGDTLAMKIEGNEALREVSRTPLFFNAILEITESGQDIPETKHLLLAKFIELYEANTEHHNALQQEPLSGRCGDFLVPLAEQLTSGGSIVVDGDSALKIISAVVANLISDGRIKSTVEPPDVLTNLINHHLLVRDNEDDEAIRFIHQQFQEWYTSEFLYKRMMEAAERDELDKLKPWALMVLNDNTIWGESLQFLVERLATEIEANKAALVQKELLLAIVKWSKQVHPILMGEIVRWSGDIIWDDIKSWIVPFLKNWYDNSQHATRQLALATILASGRSDFSDLVWSLITHDDNQVRLRTYRLYQPEGRRRFPFAILGPDCFQKIRRESSEIIGDFLWEACVHSDPKCVDLIRDIIADHEDNKLQIKALHVARWAGVTDLIVDGLDKLSDQHWADLAEAGLDFEDIPEDLSDRLLVALRTVASRISDPQRRLAFLRRLMDRGDQEAFELFKELLEQGLSLDRETRPNFMEMLNHLAEKDKNWVSNFILSQMAKGRYLDEEFVPLIHEPDSKSIRELLDTALITVDDPDLPRGHLTVICVLADQEAAFKIWLHHLEQIGAIGNNWGAVSNAKRDYLSSLRRALPRIRWDYSLSFWETVEASADRWPDIDLIVSIALSKLAPDRYEPTDQISDSLRERLSELISNWAAFGVQNPMADPWGGTNAKLAEILGKIGGAESLPLLLDLFESERQRCALLEEEWERTKPRRPDGFGHSWDRQYLDGLSEIPSDKTEAELLSLLDDPYYGERASVALTLRALQPEERENWRPWGPDYDQVYENRRRYPGPSNDNPKRKFYAEAIATRLKELVGQVKDSDKSYHEKRCAMTLAGRLVLLEAYQTVPLIIETCSLSFDQYTKVLLLQKLVVAGHLFSFEELNRVVEPILSDALAEKYHPDEKRRLARDALALLLFSDDPERGIGRIKEMLPKLQLGYELRDLVVVLGSCKDEAASDFLVDLVENDQDEGVDDYYWCTALPKNPGRKAKELLLGFVGAGRERPMPFKGHHASPYDALVKNIAAVADDDPEFREQLLACCAKEPKGQIMERLTAVLQVLGGSDAASAACSLLGADGEISVLPILEHQFTQHIPIDENSNIYEIVPAPQPELKRDLFKRWQGLGDQSDAALACLVHVEHWRLDHGWPRGEPLHPNLESGVDWSDALSTGVSNVEAW